jgi:hypothetical protein
VEHAGAQAKIDGIWVDIKRAIVVKIPGDLLAILQIKPGLGDHGCKIMVFTETCIMIVLNEIIYG